MVPNFSRGMGAALAHPGIEKERFMALVRLAGHASRTLLLDEDHRLDPLVVKLPKRLRLLHSLVPRLSETGFWGLVLLLTSGAMVLALLKKRIALGEWAFWGLYVLVLLDRYGLESDRLAHQGNAPPGALGFFLLATWLM